ncbi:YncE family protein [Zavarzinella formosa]|uniref:YncE family protein n=1 Tax=Zavarzinella formosa TaxID=360055 RepID=UPI00036F6D1E|nr:hypothetical protein [Zavarzinella formosa]
MQTRSLLILSALAIIGCQQGAAPVVTQSKTADETPKKAPPVVRLVIQDHPTASLKWADVRFDEKSQFSIDPLQEVPGLPKLDAAKQKLVQMKEVGGLVMVGVRDESEGKFQSGWMLIHPGVRYVDHGDHGHWRFMSKPVLWDHRLDESQGNPAHLYVYGNRFFLANDRLNGYTRIDPAKYEDNSGKVTKPEPQFLAGGGNHITLAVADDKAGYSCWIDGRGPNKGRVDVTPITGKGRSEPAYSFHLPTGGIHGATENSGKVFFAPMDGICWTDADPAVVKKPADVKVRHIPLGKDGDKPRRTGAFSKAGHHVVFTTGREENSSLVILNAKEADPKPLFVPLAVKKGSQATTPEIVTRPDGKVYAFLFHDHAKDVDVQDWLEIVALDPDGDGRFADAKVVKTLKVGKSCVEGHFGHHSIAFDADRRFGFFTNPGDSSVSVLSLKTLEIVTTFAVGGAPTTVVAIGALETND